MRRANTLCLVEMQTKVILICVKHLLLAEGPALYVERCLCKTQIYFFSTMVILILWKGAVISWCVVEWFTYTAQEENPLLRMLNCV